MLVVVVSDTKEFRRKHMETFAIGETDVVVLDDSMVSITDLEQYLYPSLFSTSATLVHVQFMLEQTFGDMTAVMAKKLIASPTIFFFEEFSLPASSVTTLKKYGAVTHVEAPIKKGGKGADLFALASSIIAPNKKDAWMNYQKALSVQPVEALLGIMYWKVRDMMIKSPTKKEQYKELYTNLLQAHAKAWQTGTPLELMIEKVLLQ